MSQKTISTKKKKKKRCTNKLIRCKALDKITKSTYVETFLHSIKVKVQTGRQTLAINYLIKFRQGRIIKKKKKKNNNRERLTTLATIQCQYRFKTVLDEVRPNIKGSILHVNSQLYQLQYHITRNTS